MRYDALMIIDVQEYTAAMPLYNRENFLLGLKMLTEACRSAAIPVIFIRHIPTGSTAETAETRILPLLEPRPEEKVFVKRFNSAFKDTGLDEYLRGRSMRRLILTGIKTEQCVDTTCKTAFERGYELTVPAGGATTVDNEFIGAALLNEYYEKHIWAGRFATVKPLTELLADINRQKG